MKFIQQYDSMDCGLSCLAMLCSHYGHEYSRKQLQQSFILKKDGVSLLGISKVAEDLGFKTVGGKLSFNALMKEAPLPCIIHWDQNHFVVVIKIKKHRKASSSIYIADPGKGFTTYTKEEFCEHWVSTKTDGEEKGIALLLEPTEQFYAQKTEETIPTHNLSLIHI